MAQCCRGASSATICAADQIAARAAPAASGRFTGAVGDVGATGVAKLVGARLRGEERMDLFLARKRG